MSVNLNYYENMCDYTWYDSTNVLYSECYDNEGDKKDLKLVFKGGKSYLYKDVDVNDYLGFRLDPSQGKALNRLITCKMSDGKPKYEYLRLPDVDLDEIMKRKELIIENRKNGELENKGITPYTTSFDSEDGIIRLYYNGIEIFSGKDGYLTLYEVLDALNLSVSNVN